MVAKRVVDGKILWLARLFLKAGVMDETNRWRDTKGTPQGGVISPLLANIYLDKIDKGLKPINYSAKLIRYADDLVVMTRYSQQRTLERLKELVTSLKLQLKESKTRILNAQQQTFDFLGFTFIRPYNSYRGKHTTYFYPAKRAENAIKLRIRQIADHSCSAKIEKVVEELAPVLRGWVNYFRLANSSRKFNKIKFYTAQKVRKFMRRRRHKAGYGWREYTDMYLYQTLGLYNDYRLLRVKT